MNQRKIHFFLHGCFEYNNKTQNLERIFELAMQDQKIEEHLPATCRSKSNSESGHRPVTDRSIPLRARAKRQHKS